MHSIKQVLKGALFAAVLASVPAGAAMAQVCAETQFTAKTGQLYLDAETAALANKDYNTALSKLNQLRAGTLNCYEEGAVLKLGAYIKIEKGDREGAVQDLLAALQKGYIPAADRAGTYFNIAQIYLQAEDEKSAMKYMNEWLKAGGKADRNQKWQMAVLSQRAGNDRDAIKWAEETKTADGANVKQEVLDFLLYLYDRTGDKAKVAALLEDLVQRKPNELKYWQAISGNYMQGNDERRAFEVQKAMYLGGLLKSEGELMNIVNFYNRLNAPYHAARILEKEMNAGRIKQTNERLSLLADLYQVAREHEKAIPVIQKLASSGGGGAAYERLGRSYADLQQWAKAEDALNKALSAGGLKDRGTALVMIGQGRIEQNDRAGARDAFRKAGNEAGRNWLAFLDSEEVTKAALACFEIQSVQIAIENEAKSCKQIAVIGAEGQPVGCKTIDQRKKDIEAKMASSEACKRAGQAG